MAAVKEVILTYPAQALILREHLCASASLSHRAQESEGFTPTFISQHAEGAARLQSHTSVSLPPPLHPVCYGHRSGHSMPLLAPSEAGPLAYMYRIVLL